MKKWGTGDMPIFSDDDSKKNGKADADSKFVLTQAEAAQYLGIGLDTFRKYVRAGMPCLKRGGRGAGRAWAFNGPDVVEWFVNYKISELTGDVEGQKRDREYWETIKAEEKAKQEIINTAQMQGKVADLEDLERRLSHAIMKLGNALERLPAYCAPLLEGKTRREIKKTLEEEIDRTRLLITSDCIYEDEPIDV